MGYAGWLSNLARDQNLPVHIELSDLGKGAGDPFSRIQMALERVARLERDREAFAGRYAFLDTDQLVQDYDRAERARRMARQERLEVIWQDPTHEAFLLRHFPGFETHRPPDKRAADAALTRKWAGYEKPRTAQQLEQKFDIGDAHRVGIRLESLSQLLRQIGLAN